MTAVRDPLRLLAFKIENDFSSEARVFSNLLAHREGLYDARVVYHQWPGETNGADEFAHCSDVELLRADLGWRPSPGGWRAPVAKARTIARLARMLPVALRRARDYAPDVVYSSQQDLECIAATWVARRLRRPQLIHLHYNVPARPPRPKSPSQLIHWLPCQRQLTCAHVVAISDYIREQAIRHGTRPDRVTTVHNSVAAPPPFAEGVRTEVRRELGVPDGAPLVGIVARLVSWKGQLDTIAAFARVAEAFPGARLLIVGDGPDRAAMEEQAARTGFGARIVFTGQRRDVPRLLAAMDLFAHPAREEPFGLAVAEASAAGLPVLAYDEGGVREVVEHGVTGRLVPSGDVDALADALRAWLRDPAAARALGEAGRRRIAERFAPEKAARAFANVLAAAARSGLVR